MKKYILLFLLLFVFFIPPSSAVTADERQNAAIAMGDGYFNTSQYSQAKDAYMEALSGYQGMKKDPNTYAATWYKVGLCNLNLGSYERALDNFDTALVYVVDPVLKNSLQREKANALLYLRRFSEAEIFFVASGLSSQEAKERVSEYIRIYETAPHPAMLNQSISLAPTLVPEDVNSPAVNATIITPVPDVDMPEPVSQGQPDPVMGVGIVVLVCSGILLTMYVWWKRGAGKPGSIPAKPESPAQPGHLSPSGESAEEAQPDEEPGDPTLLKTSRHHDVFISYSHIDKPVADAVCARLESDTIRCWIAPRDVSPGENFPDAIIRAIEGSRVMILIYSSHANTSPHVLRELTKAVSTGLVIIPFRIEDAPLSRSMEYLLGLPHWLDALTPPLEEHITKMAAMVRSVLENR